MSDPCIVWHLTLHEWLILMANVGKYTVRPMDPIWVKGRSFFEEKIRLGHRLMGEYVRTRFSKSGVLVSILYRDHYITNPKKTLFLVGNPSKLP